MFDLDDLPEVEPSQPDDQPVGQNEDFDVIEDDGIDEADRREARNAAADLSSGDSETRHTACRTLGKLGDAAEPYIPKLTAVAETDADFDVKRAAKKAIKDIKNPRPKQAPRPKPPPRKVREPEYDFVAWLAEDTTGPSRHVPESWQLEASEDWRGQDVGDSQQAEPAGWHPQDSSSLPATSSAMQPAWQASSPVRDLGGFSAWDSSALPSQEAWRPQGRVGGSEDVRRGTEEFNDDGDKQEFTGAFGLGRAEERTDELPEVPPAAEVVSGAASVAGAKRANLLGDRRSRFGANWKRPAVSSTSQLRPRDAPAEPSDALERARERQRAEKHRRDRMRFEELEAPEGAAAAEPQAGAETAAAPVAAVPEDCADDIAEDVPWPRARFKIVRGKNKFEVLSMRLEREAMTPAEVTEVWETAWGVQYASRIKFEAPPDSPTKYLSAQEDAIPLSPYVVKLDVKGTSISILYSLATALRQFGRMSREEVAEERERQRQQQEADALKRERADAKEGGRYQHFEARRKYDARPR